MKLALVTLAVSSACVTGSPTGTGRRPANPLVKTAIPVPEVAASQWVSAHPTYVVLSPSLADAQQALLGLVDTIGPFVGVDTSAVRAGLASVLTIDPLDARIVANTGIDVRGGIAMFSDDLAPTFVVHLHDAARFRQFLDGLRNPGFAPTVRVLEGVAVTSVPLAWGLMLSWAVDGEWLWLHVTLPGIADAGTWFSSSHHPDPAAPWLPDFAWAKQIAGGSGVIGVADLHALVERLGQGAAACIVTATSIRRLGLSSATGTHTDLRLTAELADGKGADLQRLLHTPTEGWDGFAAGAPLHVQWNLDVPSLSRVQRSCGFDVLAGLHDPVGVRALRAAVLTIDPRLGVGTGVVEASLLSTRFVTDQLDEIPLRSHLESDVRFGPLGGKHLKIPFTSFSLDYVLSPSLTLIGVGDGLLARAVGRGVAGSTQTVARVEIHPHAMSVSAWRWLLDKVIADAAGAVTTALQHWHDLRFAVTVDHDLVTVDLRADR